MNAPAVMQRPGYARVAKKSDDYVAEMIDLKRKVGGRTLTGSQRQAQIDTIMKDAYNGFRRIGQSMIGPIQVQLRYQGIVRNVLMEDTLTPGVPVQYDVLDDLGQAYILHGNEGEVRITPFEGKRIDVQLFRIAEFATVKKEDLYMLRSNIVEYAQDQVKQSIMRQEDYRCMALLEVAAEKYQDVDASARPGTGSLPNEITVAGSRLMPDDLYTAVTYTDQRMLESSRLLVNPQEWRDMFRWDINTTGWAFKDQVVAGEKIVSFGEFQIGKSVIITPGTSYLTPDPEFLGVMPVMYSLDVVENNKPQDFVNGWVYDELLGMMILNPRGIVIMRKA